MRDLLISLAFSCVMMLISSGLVLICIYQTAASEIARAHCNSGVIGEVAEMNVAAGRLGLFSFIWEPIYIKAQDDIICNKN